MRQPNGHSGGTRTSSEDTSPVRAAHQLKSTRRKALSLRSESSSKLATLRPTSTTPRPRPRHSSTDSSQLTSPELNSFPGIAAEVPARPSTRNSNEGYTSNIYKDERLRHLFKFQDEDTFRGQQRPSHDSVRSPKGSIESPRFAPRPSTDRAHSDRQAKRKSITVIPESKTEWDVRPHSPVDTRPRRKSDKVRPNTISQDSVAPAAGRRLLAGNDDVANVEPEDGRPTPIVDPRKMLQLMRTTRGRMQGRLHFRQVIAQPWEEAQCFIDADSGSLCSTDEGKQQNSCLLQDLRKCKVQAVLHRVLGATVLHISTVVGRESLQICPISPQYLNAWFAAMLCWSSVQLGQHLTARREQQRPNLIRQISNYLPLVDQGQGDNPIRKAGNAMLIEVDKPKERESLTDSPQASKTTTTTTTTTWRPVSCLLNAKGELRILSQELQFIATVHLADFPRSAVQRLGMTVFGADCIIAIYPQYAQSTTACSRLRPIYLSFESRELYEVWFVLMRAHAIPELYGTSRMQAASPPLDVGVLPGLEPSVTPLYFRLERSLHLKLNEAKIYHWDVLATKTGDGTSRGSGAGQHKSTTTADYRAEILLDGQVKAKSTIKYQTVEPVWYDQFDFHDFASGLSCITIRLKRQIQSRPGQQIDELSTAPIPGVPPPKDQSQRWPRSGNSPTAKAFEVVGEAVIETSMLASGVDIESWYLLSDDVGNVVGEVSVKIRQEEDTVLMDREYDAVSDLLHNFSNALTLQMYERIPLELGRLSTCLLDIFQVSGQATEWLMALAEEEVDGVREQAVSRTRFTHRLDSKESHESLATLAASSNREGVVRELNKSATQEANLLFRGNSLLSKALDFHMRRVGHVYLDETIGSLLRQIASRDFQCEVDPAKTAPDYDLQKAWRRLESVTATLWDRIRKSANNCPAELRTIFRHIRACADDRYGDYMRSVTYSSVSGFLFLRFFCAAILNPHLFGLVTVSASGNAQRTFILVAKSLNGLASMSTFGSKEPWMAPMNSFLSDNRQTFKKFIDEICSIRSDEPASPMPTSYGAPVMIFNKLPLTSREGFPSLPYLIDRARSLATLVDIWLEGLKGSFEGPNGTINGAAKLSNSLTGDLARFHDICLALRQRTRAAFHAADRSERVPSGLAHRWVATAERMEVAPEEFWSINEASRSVSINPSPQSTTQSDASFAERKKRLSVKSPSRRKSKQKQECAPSTLVPPTRPFSTAGYRPSSSSRPRTASQPIGRPVATAAQLNGSTYMNNAGLAFSSTATSEDGGVDSDDDGRGFVIRTMRDLSGDNLPGIVRKRSQGRLQGLGGKSLKGGREGRELRDAQDRKDWGRDQTLTPESLRGRVSKLGLDDGEKERKAKRGFWRRRDRSGKADEELE
ncbi:MAG: hypothetical protein Q9159_006409 [Coniocarpon cinnabarinum]